MTSGVVHSANVDNNVQGVHFYKQEPGEIMRSWCESAGSAILTDFGITSPGQIGILILRRPPQEGNAESLIRVESSRVRSDGLFDTIPQIASSDLC